MYTSFFGLNEKPFSITPDPRYLFMSERHGEALAHLVYGVTESAIVRRHLKAGRWTHCVAVFSLTGKFSGGYVNGAKQPGTWRISSVGVHLAQKDDDVAFFQSFTDPGAACPEDG